MQFYFSVEKNQMNRKIELLYKTNIPKIKKKGDKESLLDTFVAVLKKKDTDALNGSLS